MGVNDYIVNEECLKALAALGLDTDYQEEVCLNCMSPNADFSIGFGHFGQCEKCGRHQMVYKVI